MSEKNISRLDAVMRILGVSALDVSKICGISNSLISRWQKGTRPLTTRSGTLEPLSAALLSLDTEGKLDELLTPYRTVGEDAQTALSTYLSGGGPSDMPARADLPQVRRSGEYTAQYRVLLGKTGFRKAALLMLDYLLVLPPGREVVVLCQGRYDWLVNDIVFVVQFIGKLKKVVERGVTLTVINRKGYSIAETAAFAGPWLAAHLRGYIRSRYYDGELPAGDRFIASIRGYWCGYAVEDGTAEDDLYITLHTEPREMRRGEMVCDAYREKSRPASQYGFLRSPAGDDETPCLWERGALPGWDEPDAETPAGCFYAISRTPCFGVMTRDEFAAVCGGDVLALPEYLFLEYGTFAPGTHKIILCREDVREALAKERSQSLPLSMLLHRRAFVTKGMLAAQLSRLLAAMDSREDFEVALAPRSAFSKLRLEMTCWQDSASVGWLQDGSESVFANDSATSGSFYGSIGYTWDKLHKGWKRKKDVARTLRKWLAGKGLDVQEQDSAIVRNWDVLPRE